MYDSDGNQLGYSRSDDKQSIKTIHAALANGISVFDTAAAYGAGHSERLLARALGKRDDVFVITKIGLKIDEATKSITGEALDPASLVAQIDGCLSRLGRDTIDLLLLHPNEVPSEQIHSAFDVMDAACQQGKIKSYGWSTDFVSNVEAASGRERFRAVEYAAHVLMDAPDMRAKILDKSLLGLIRSPLAMGLLSGKYDANSTMPSDDIRSTEQSWTNYYIDGRPNPQLIERIEITKELLRTGGRTLVQGALGWLFAKSSASIPIPGARTVEQVEGLAAALKFGALPGGVVAEIDALVGKQFVSDGQSPR